MSLRFLFFLLIISTSSFAQETQWASKILGFSSERVGINAGPEFRAGQALGKPTKISPTGEECKCAWSPASADAPGDEWIHVGFEKPQKINRVIVAENFNAGAITKIIAFDVEGKEYVVFETQPASSKENGRLLNAVYASSFDVVSVKVILISNKVLGYNQIDAIGISESKTAVIPKINLIKDVNTTLIRENLGNEVNSDSGELAPVITSDGKTLYFTRGKNEIRNGKDVLIDQDVWVSHLLPSGKFGKTTNLGAPINNTRFNAATSISADNKSLYLINVLNADGSYSKGLSKSTRVSRGWSVPKEVKIKNYFNSDEYSEFSVSPDEKIIILAAEGRTTFGGKDLYVCFKQVDGTFSEPKNLGDKINTVQDEGMPFIAADNKTLYFASEGLLGYGSSDIFLSRRQDSTWTKWIEPENLGQPINSARWDGYFSISASGEFAFLSSKENSLGREDIFRVKTPPSIRPEPVVIVSGTVINGLTKLPISAEIAAEILSDTSKTKDIKAEYQPETGEYKLILPIKKAYLLSAKLKGFMSVSENMDLTKETKYREYKRNLSLMPIQAGMNLTLNNLFFEQGKTQILESSYTELNKLVDLMIEYPKMEILLEGHSDNQGDLMENIKLSQARVDNVSRFLVVKGINSGRIKTKAWGGSKPIASNTTEETRKKNRRVEFTITKI
jgi:outer membrane protein OmpA-like peptidoglycan-associated protein